MWAAATRQARRVYMKLCCAPTARYLRPLPSQADAPTGPARALPWRATVQAGALGARPYLRGDGKATWSVPVPQRLPMRTERLFPPSDVGRAQP